MTALSNALLELRVRVLYRIAHLKEYGTDETTVRSLALAMTDAGVLEELKRRRSPLHRFFSWFDRKPAI